MTFSHPRANRYVNPLNRAAASDTAVRSSSQYPEAQGPGPPQRPHIPGAGELALLLDDELAPAAPTANTLSARAVCVDPQDGHFTFAPESLAASLIMRCIFSNFASHARQEYS